MRVLTLLDGIGEVTAKKLINNRLESNKSEVQKLKKIRYKDYSDINGLLNDSEKFYMLLELVLAKSKYTEKEIEKDFELINELARNYHSIENFISDIILDSSR